MEKKFAGPLWFAIVVVGGGILLLAIIIAFQLSIRDALIASAVAAWLAIEAIFVTLSGRKRRDQGMGKKRQRSGPWA